MSRLWRINWISFFYTYIYICIFFFIRIRHSYRFLFPKKLCYPFCPGKIEFDFSIFVREIRFISFVLRKTKSKSKWSKVVGHFLRFKRSYILPYGINDVYIQSRFLKARSNYIRYIYFFFENIFSHIIFLFRRQNHKCTEQ